MSAFNKAEIPLLTLLLPFLAGLAFAIIFRYDGFMFWLYTLFYVLLAVFVVCNIAYRKLNIYKAKWIGGLIVNLLLLLAGVCCIEARREINFADHFSKTTSDHLLIRISNEPKLSSNVLRFTALVEQAKSKNVVHPVTGSLMVSVRVDSASKNNFVYGDELLIPANFTPVEPPLNPAEFNYKAYLAHQNIYQQSFLAAQQVVIINHNQGNVLVSSALRLRRHFVEKLRNSIRDTDALAVASTIILGYRADLRKEVQEAYSKTGTMHLLSVSGMHVGLIYLLISFILVFLPPQKYGRVIKAILSITAIWCYALITGFSPAVCRASLMLTFFIVGFAFNRHINRLNLLAVSAFILLLYNPFLITDAGFQLSYLAVFGIIILQPVIYKWVTVKSKLAKEMWMVCSVSISAQVILFPVSAFYFHDFPVLFLVSNLFIIVPSLIVMYGGIAYLILPNIPVISSALAWFIEKTIVIMTRTLSAIEHAPLGSINKIWLNPVESVLFYGLLISAFYVVVNKNKRPLKVSFLLLAFIAISISIKRYYAMNTNSITFFSLRKNTAILLRNGEQAVLVTDLTPQDKNYQYSIQPYLDSCKITSLQNISLTGNISYNYMAKQRGLVQFGDKKILIIDKATSNNLFAGKINLDYIYITGSPKTDLAWLKRNYNFKTLIVDGHNSNNLISKLQAEALLAKADLKTLKRNNSIIIVSKR
ncbi:ComEC/Rec2 family competence protein [Mucilaginibacter sp. AW1-3]